MLEAVIQWKVLLVCYWKASNRKFIFENVTLLPNFILILAIEQRSWIFTLYEIAEAI